MTLSIQEAAREYPSQIGLICEDREYSFAELAERSDAAMSQLDGLGWSHKRRRIITPTRNVDTIALLYAAWELGAPVALLHPRLTQHERHVLLGQLEDGDSQPAGATTRNQRTSIPNDAELAVVFTSGSSAAPRGVSLSRGAFIASAEASAANLGWQDNDRWLCCLPLCHVGGLSIVVRCLLARRCVVLAPEGRFDPYAFAHTMETTRTTLVSIVPSMLHRLLTACPDWTPPPALRCVLLGGAHAHRSLLQHAAAKNVPFVTTYGMTEMASQVCTQDYALRGQVRTDVGRCVAGAEVRIDERGRIEIRGPMQMSGYLDQPLPRTHWFTSGDMGTLIGDRLQVFGRADDVIVTGGENVHPSEIENCLLACPDVHEVCVYGLADETWGSIVAASVVPMVGVSNSDLRAAIHSWSQQSLAPFKRPRHLVICEALPRTSNGKINRLAAAGTD